MMLVLGYVAIAIITFIICARSLYRYELNSSGENIDTVAISGYALMVGMVWIIAVPLIIIMFLIWKAQYWIFAGIEKSVDD